MKNNYFLKRLVCGAAALTLILNLCACSGKKEQEPVTQTVEPTETGESAQESEKRPEPEEESTQNDDESAAQDPSAAQL